MIERLLDTNFLVSRWRGGLDSPAAAWLEANRDIEVGLPWIVKAEFLRGAAVAGHGQGEVGAFLTRFPTAWPDDATLDLYASLYAELRKANALPGPNDLWIAASALQMGVPFVTRNTVQFSKFRNLKIEAY